MCTCMYNYLIYHVLVGLFACLEIITGCFISVSITAITKLNTSINCLTVTGRTIKPRHMLCHLLYDVDKHSYFKLANVSWNNVDL